MLKANCVQAKTTSFASKIRLTVQKFAVQAFEREKLRKKKQNFQNYEVYETVACRFYALFDSDPITVGISRVTFVYISKFRPLKGFKASRFSKSFFAYFIEYSDLLEVHLFQSTFFSIFQFQP